MGVGAYAENPQLCNTHQPLHEGRKGIFWGVGEQGGRPASLGMRKGSGQESERTQVKVNEEKPGETHCGGGVRLLQESLRGLQR